MRRSPVIARTLFTGHFLEVDVAGLVVRNIPDIHELPPRGLARKSEGGYGQYYSGHGQRFGSHCSTFLADPDGNPGGL